jgi:hypothetical protein
MVVTGARERQLPSISSTLEQNKLLPNQLISESDWQEQHQEAPPQAKAEGMGCERTAARFCHYNKNPNPSKRLGWGNW